MFWMRLSKGNSSFRVRWYCERKLQVKHFGLRVHQLVISQTRRLRSTPQPQGVQICRVALLRPSSRSDHSSLVRAAANDGESMVVLSGMLSSSTNGDAANNMDVIFLRHSSSFSFDGIDSYDTLPTAMVPSVITSSVLPVPWTGASTIANGT